MPEFYLLKVSSPGRSGRIHRPSGRLSLYLLLERKGIDPESPDKARLLSGKQNIRHKTDIPVNIMDPLSYAGYLILHCFHPVSA